MPGNGENGVFYYPQTDIINKVGGMHYFASGSSYTTHSFLEPQ